MGPASMIVLILAAVAFSSIAILIAKLVLKATKNPQKQEPYECGVPTQGKTWTQLNVGYYLFALFFISELLCKRKPFLRLDKHIQPFTAFFKNK